MKFVFALSFQRRLESRSVLTTNTGFQIKFGMTQIEINTSD